MEIIFNQLIKEEEKVLSQSFSASLLRDTNNMRAKFQVRTSHFPAGRRGRRRLVLGVRPLACVCVCVKATLLH